MTTHGQSKLFSLIEQLFNIGSGFIIAVCLWAFVVTPYLGIEYDVTEAMHVTLMFTAVSIIRGYLWRRAGNFITERYHK